jgi:tetratricopeptide (TPR) repeat protein
MKQSYYLTFIFIIVFICGCAYFSNTTRAYRYIVRKKPNQAIKILDKEIATKPNDYWAYFYRGVAYSQLKDNNKAISNYSQSIEINPNCYYAYLNRSLCYRNINKNALAIEDINKVISLKPKMYCAYVRRGNLYQDLKKNQKAISDYEKALSLQPKRWEALLCKADILYEMGNYKKSMHDYNILTELYSQNPIICDDVAWRLATCPKKKYRNTNRAFLLAKKAYKLFPSFVTSDTLAAVYARKKDFKNAIKYQQEAIKRALQEYGNDASDEFVPDLNERLESYKKNISWTEDVGKPRKGVVVLGGIIRK